MHQKPKVFVFATTVYRQANLRLVLKLEHDLADFFLVIYVFSVNLRACDYELF